MSNYSEKLKDPRWQKKRLEIFKRDNWACQFCGDTTQTLHVHHLLYHSGHLPWEYDESELITLCEYCHDIESNFRKEVEVELLKSLLLSKFSVNDIQELSVVVNSATSELVEFVKSKYIKIEFQNGIGE